MNAIMISFISYSLLILSSLIVQPNCVGRSVPLGTFDTLDLVKLYFFASASLFTNLSKVDIVELSIIKQDNGEYTGWIYADRKSVV